MDDLQSAALRSGRWVSARGVGIHPDIPPHPDWMLLEPLSDHDWLVVDLGQEALTGTGVIGHIQYLSGAYEALDLSDPLGRSFFDSFDCAAQYFAPRSRAASVL
jgi:hypothetical protein